MIWNSFHHVQSECLVWNWEVCYVLISRKKINIWNKLSPWKSLRSSSMWLGTKIFKKFSNHPFCDYILKGVKIFWMIQNSSASRWMSSFRMGRFFSILWPWDHGQWKIWASHIFLDKGNQLHAKSYALISTICPLVLQQFIGDIFHCSLCDFILIYIKIL